MKTAACILLLAALAYSAEVTMMENMGDDVVYRISWNTQYDPDPAKTSSKGTYKINIKSVDGATETGEKTLVTHPGYQCGAASDPECFPDITGAVLADGDASAKCAFDPSKDGYDEAAAKWKPFAGTVQHYFLKATDVGEVGEVILSGDSNTDDSWTPGFLKINMNDMETGVGNGIYYMDIGKKINKDKTLTMKAGATDSYGEKIKMENKASHQYGISECDWLLQYFDVRKEARTSEIDALGKAKAVLSG